MHKHVVRNGQDRTIHTDRSGQNHLMDCKERFIDNKKSSPQDVLAASSLETSTAADLKLTAL